GPFHDRFSRSSADRRRTRSTPSAPGPKRTWSCPSRLAIEAVLNGQQSRLRPAGEAELGQDVGDVGARRPLGDAEVVRDLAVREAAGDTRKDVTLAGR